MARKKEQKIIVSISFNSDDNALILNGIRIAVIFKKELCLLYNYTKREKENYEQLKMDLKKLTVPIAKEIPGLSVSTLLLSESKRNLPEVLSDNIEGILILAAKKDFKKHATSISESPIPYLFINTDSQITSNFKRLILPIDLRKENSESALWSSYFGRFNKAEIVVVAANDKGKNAKKDVTKNVLLTKKLYQKFNIQHKVYKGTKSSLQNSFEAQQLAANSGSDLLIMLGSSTVTPLDWLIGLPEKKIILNSGDLPVLLVNPRKDNYVLCD